ncbi:MAG: bifunctional YncE family protein/alkaline phosphatase family protein [Acidobacteriota bacterium]
MSSIILRRFLSFAGIIVVCVLAVSYFAAKHSLRTEASPIEPETVDFIPVTPAGRLLIDNTTGLPAVAPLTMNFVRTPDSSGPDGKGRYLIGVNSGYGIELTSKSKPNQSLSVIDLNAKPEPQVIQNIYFPSPQSANFGLVFDLKPQSDGKYRLYLSGGFENKIWMLNFDPAATRPLLPGSEPDKKFDSPFIDVSAFAENAPSPNYNSETPPVYPTGIALSPDGNSIYSANDLSDNLGVVSDLRDTRKIARVALQRPGSSQFLYPYDVRLLTKGNSVSKVYVSLWGDGTVAVVDPAHQYRLTHIQVERHPTLMVLNKTQTRLFVVNSDADSISVIDTATDKVIETIKVHLSEAAKNGVSPEGLALSGDENTMFVANAHANAVAVVKLEANPAAKQRSKLLGFIPTGNYASAVACVGNRLFIANGKGTGMENSSVKITDSGLYPNMPNKDFPGGTSKRGMYSAAIVSGNISVINVPDEKQLYGFTQQTMRNNGLVGQQKRDIFPDGRSPFKHVIYIIRENRTYDQVLGDVTASGDGRKADGDGSVAIFGGADAARSPNGEPQVITPNAHAIAQRFGLLDRFFVNAEASPDGHNWSTAAFSSDYVDKAFRWHYSRRGQTYDYEGYNRLPSFDSPANQPQVAMPPVFDLPATTNDVGNYVRKYIPYLHGARDIAEPESLYLWDAAKRAGLTYRNYGEFITNVSADDLRSINTQKPKKYPDVSPNLTAFGNKKTLEGHVAPQAHNFDLQAPDALTTDSYRAAKESKDAIDPAITTDNANPAFQGNSRFGSWRDEFRRYVSDLQAGKGDNMPSLSIVRISNDHTDGLHRGIPTPQFYVAENDYAVGRLVEEVSKSPYWKDTAIFVVEDDAQDGPDHVDAHRSPALVISAYNRPGALVHEFHNTVSLIRTIELCLGLEPMNFLDSNATPIAIFTDKPDLRPYNAALPNIALNNLYPPDKPTGKMAYYMQLTDKQDLTHADMADPQALNEIIWYSVRGDTPMPGIARLPAFDLLTTGLKTDEKEDKKADDDD